MNRQFSCRGKVSLGEEDVQVIWDGVHDGRNFVEAYVVKNAYKEKIRRLEATEEKKSKQSSTEKMAASSCGGSSRGGRGLFGLIKKKQVHPKAAASPAAIETGHEASS
jgi:hypothetical protein